LDCPINDIDSTWADGATGNMLHQLAVGSSRQRYFIVRNLVNFEYSAWRSNKLLYLINKAVVLALVRAMAALRGDRSLWSDVITAVRSGEASDLSASPALD
jgi:hypothetical protein